MAENDTPANAQTTKSTPSNDPNDFPIGSLASFPYSPEPFAKLTDAAKGALMALDVIATKTDVAARRLEVEQAWQALHFSRGYQHLFKRRGGGWELPGEGSGFNNAKSHSNHDAQYETNIYSTKGEDIIVAALSREIPKMEFFPANPEYAPDIVAAEESENFKQIWSRNNNLHALLVECSRIFWNEDRVLLWTRYEINGQKYGFEEDNLESPTVPEDVLSPPDSEPTGQEGQEDFLAAEETLLPEGTTDSVEESPAEEQTEEAAESDAGGEELVDALEEVAERKPLGREITTAHGKLDHKVPIAVDNMCDMHFIQLYQDTDEAVAKAMFPWIAEKIHAGSDGQSEVELDRIARENVRQAVLGSYVTGDSQQRHVVVKYTWFRPSMFMDKSVNDVCKAELLETFPNGCLLVKAGSEYAFSRNESMDKHLVIGHALGGKGQNRRALGTAMIPIQKRVNDWVDIMDDFFKRTIPKKWYNAEAFDMQAMKDQPNMPGSSGSFQPQPGLASSDQYMMVEPTPQPQAALPDFVKWFITSLTEEISGALPSLFGSPTNTDTVGGIAIQRDQALQRIGCPWNNIQDMFAEAALQAVWCAAECRDGKRITQNIQGRGNVSVNTANLAGNVLCYAESNPAFPESWQQKEAKILQLIDGSANIPDLAKFLFHPINLPALADSIRLKTFKVPGASSITKQKSELEILLRSGPMPNPKVVQMKQTLDEATQGMASHVTSGQPIPPQAPQMMNQLEQMIKSLPPTVSTVPVAQDESEEHLIEAAQCLEWATSGEGQKFKYGLPKQKAAYENVLLHWKEHMEMAKKIAAANAPSNVKPPSESISVDVSKMPGNVASQALAKMGIEATPADFAQHMNEQTNQAVQKKAVPEALKGPSDKTPPPGQGQEPPRQLRR
jgi:hypothetical protein